MIIGIPKEIKNNENRVALTPAGAKELVKRGHTVYVQHTAGINSGFADDAYVAAGARILPAIEDVYGIAALYHGKGESLVGCEMEVGEDKLSFANQGIFAGDRFFYFYDHLGNSIYILSRSKLRSVPRNE